MQEKLKSNAGHHPGTWPWKKGSSKARSLKTQVDAPVKSMRLGRAKDLCGTAGDGGAIVKVANESRETRTQPQPELWGPDLTGAADRVRLVTWRAASSPPASTGMWRLFFQPFQTGNRCNGKSQATTMAQETRSMAPSASGIDQPPTKGTAIRNVTIASRKVEKPNSQGKRRPSTVDERTTDDDEHEAWHHARSWHPSNRSRPACRDRVSSRQTGVYGIPLGRGVRHAAAGSVSLEPSSVT